jgi:hypothetical protein
MVIVDSRESLKSRPRRHAVPVDRPTRWSPVREDAMMHSTFSAVLRNCFLVLRVFLHLLDYSYQQPQHAQRECYR